MKNDNIYLLFGEDYVINLICNMENTIDDVIVEMNGNYDFKLYVYNPNVDGTPVSILFNFVSSGYRNYITLSETEYIKLNKL